MGLSEENMKKWLLAYKKRGEDIFDFKDGLEIIEPPGVMSYADPFLFEDYLFFEEFDQKKGIISCFDLKKGDFANPVKVLERPYHLSYPCVFEDGGDIYMIPETGKNNTIEIYKANPFPYSWTLVKTIMRGVISADSNIIKHDGRYYLFSTFHGDNNLEIHRADALLGDWGLHTRQQIVNSRGAGNIFEHEGMLVRPVQNSTKELYGYGIIFRKITVAPYTESEIHRINPDWMEGLLGTHTFNFNDKWVVIDGKYEA